MLKDIPHACKQLHQASVSECKANHYIGRTQAPCPHIDQPQNERCQGKSAQSQGRRVGDATVLDLFVQTWLEFTAKGRQALVAIGSIDMSQRTVAEASGSFGCLVFLVGHVPVHSTATICFFVVIVRAIAGEFGVGMGGHCDGEEVFERPRAVEVEVGEPGGRNSWGSIGTTGGSIK